MQTKILVLFVTALFFTPFIHSQDRDLVLLKIDNEPVYTSEFKRVYLKNIDLVKDESQKDIDQYLELFIKYKLKLKEAKSLGYDQKESYVQELEGYRKQLSSGFLTDNEVSEELVKEAYNRTIERINASHILIEAKPNASAKDTLVAYQKVMDIRKKFLAGGDFKELAKANSQDPSAKMNGGDLGWFSAFRMVYPFEDAAYKTEVGGVSMPFRTRFGYHIVKVNERQKSLGEVTVAHIMVAFSKDRTEADAEKRIKEIQEQIHQNASFESLAKQYSDDRNTAVNGGKINKFGQGGLNSESFESAAFALEKIGDVSEPVKTKFGWHIIQLLEKHPPKTFEELKTELTNRVRKDQRSKLITTSFINSLKTKYGVKRNEKAIEYFTKIVIDSIYGNKEVVLSKSNEVLMTLGKETYPYSKFTEFLRSREGTSRRYTDSAILIENMYKEFVDSELLTYYEAHLEEDNQEFADVFSDYRDGLLLFDLMENKVWSVAKSDSLGLKGFYEKHKDNYRQNKSYKIVKASSANKKVMDQLKTIMEKGAVIDEIKKEAKKLTEESVLFAEEQLVIDEDELANKLSGEKGSVISLDENNYVTLVRIEEILEPRLKTFEETKGKVINDFQESVENKWLQGLRTKYTVEVEKRTLKKIKKELSI